MGYAGRGRDVISSLPFPFYSIQFAKKIYVFLIDDRTYFMLYLTQESFCFSQKLKIYSKELHKFVLFLIFLPNTVNLVVFVISL